MIKDENIPFNTDSSIYVEIPNHAAGTPVEILYKNLLLYYDIRENQVFFGRNSEYDTHKWIIEHDAPFYYIKNVANFENNICYLGSPNKNNRVFLYTSKNRFTRWNIEPVLVEQKYNINLSGNTYKLSYIGEKFNTNDITIVIARYNEDTRWVIPYNDISIIYNKGESNIKHIDRIIKLDNIGREGHTYLYHIINNYGIYTDKTFFVQGEPFQHNHTLLYAFDNYEKTLPVQSLGLIYLRDKNIPPPEIEEKFKIITNYGLQYLILDIDGNGHCEYFTDTGIIRLNKICREIFNTVEMNNVGIIEGFLKRARFPYNKPFDYIDFSYAGLFGLNKEIIMKYDVSVYYNLLNELISDGIHGSANGYLLERSWLYIFI